MAEIPIEILLVEDNPADVRLTQESFKDGKLLHKLNVVTDGVEAINYLNGSGKYADRIIPDMILLDLNLPKKDGREVLEEIKADPGLRNIPVIILTTSEDEEDILKSYNLHANCFITKPVDFIQFTHVIQTISEFWFSVVKLPPKNEEF